jgi:hypothetical protein
MALEDNWHSKDVGSPRPQRASNLPEYLRRVKYVLHNILGDMKIKAGIIKGESL